MLYTFLKVREILSVNKDTVTSIIFNFKSYFSSNCTNKNQERKFTIEDICKLSYIIYYWEEDPDIESIEIGLNRKEYSDYPFSQHYFELIPLIRNDFESDISQSSDSVFFNRALFNSNFELASEYFKATKILINSSKNSDVPWLKL